MRDRLIELLTDNLPKADNPLQFVSDEIVERLADYLLANGVIVPPCKVGDNVYWINRVSYKIMTDEVISIHQYEDGFTITTKTIGQKSISTYGLDRFLEIMHFTKEEAEQALKGGADNAKIQN